MTDKITLTGILLYGFHGVLPEEREKGQLFEIDAELFLETAQAAESDDLSRTVDYAKVYDSISSAFFKSKLDLIESVAAELAKEVLLQFPVDRVAIRVRKLKPPLPGPVRHVEVGIERDRDWATRLTSD